MKQLGTVSVSDHPSIPPPMTNLRGTGWQNTVTSGCHARPYRRLLRCTNLHTKSRFLPAMTPAARVAPRFRQCVPQVIRGFATSTTEHASGHATPASRFRRTLTDVLIGSVGVGLVVRSSPGSCTVAKRMCTQDASPASAHAVCCACRPVLTLPGLPICWIRS